MQNQHQALPLSLKGKLGIVLGVTLAAGAGLGARYCFRRDVSDSQAGDFSDGHPTTAAGNGSETAHANSSAMPGHLFDVHLTSHDDAVSGNGYPIRPGSPFVPRAENISAGGLAAAGKRGRRHIDIPDMIKEANRKIIWHLYNENYLAEAAVNKKHMLAAASEYLLTVDSDEPSGQEDRMSILARKILATADLYGGKESESVSAAQAKSAVSYWFFTNALGGNPGEIIARKMALSKSPTTYTPEKIKEYFSFEKLYSEALSSANEAEKQYFDAFAIMWDKILNEEMPFLKFASALDESFVLYGEKFASLYAGAKFLQENGHWRYSSVDAMKVGDVIWRLAINGNVTVEQFAYLELPSLFFMARHSPEKVTNVIYVHDLSASAILECIEYRKKSVITALYHHYRTAVNAWRSKGELADNILSWCPTGELLSLPDIADGIRHQQERREKALPGAKQDYLLGWRKPCKSAPESLSDEYKKLTVNVADKYLELDRYFVELAFNTLPVDDYKFISAAGVIMRPVYFSMSKNGAVWFAYNTAIDTGISVILNKTDLFSLTYNKEERIYALKQTNNEKEFYTIIRVDKDIKKYIHSGILDSDRFDTHYKVEGNTVKSQGMTFGYSIHTDQREISARAVNIESLIHSLSTAHSEKLYHSLFAAGNDSSDIAKIWNLVKYTIPFYDCIEGIVNNDPVQAVPSCIMDGLPVGPVLGMASDLSTHFAMKLAYGVRRGVVTTGKTALSLAVKNTLSHVSLPTAAEISVLGKTALRSIDPGFELLSTVSRSFSKKIALLLASDSKTSYLSRDIVPLNTVDSQPLPLSAESVMTSVPGTEIIIPLKRIADANGRHFYVQFNPETGEEFGIRYHRDGEQFYKIAMEYPGGVFSAEDNLESILNDAPALHRDRLIQLIPDDKGLYSYVDSSTRQKKHALKVSERFYQIRPGRESWSMRVSGEKNEDIKVARFDNLYYRINEANRLDVKYKPCRAERSPGAGCVHISFKLDAIFKKNKHYGIPEGDLSSIKPAKSHPGLYVNPDGKLYIKYEDVFFRLKSEGPKTPDEILSVIGPKSGGILDRIMKKRIAEVTVSREGGGYYLNTPEENMMECAGTSKAEAELHSSMRRLSFMDYRDFFIPADLRATASIMDKKILNNRDYYAEGLTPEEENIVTVFRKETDAMLAEAKKFFKKGVSYINQCHIPAIALTDKPQDIFSKIYEKNNGIAIGEYHSSIASKKFIIENIDLLHKNGVRTLYIEHLQTDMHQADLDSYFRTGKMPVSLQKFITGMDSMFDTDLLGFYTFMTLIQTAQKRKIRITAIDSFVSYYGISPSSGTSDRVALMNYYSHLLINKNQLHHQSKWIALVGSAHTNTFEGVPGLADLNGVVSIRVNDLPAGEAGAIFKDPGEVYRSLRARRARIVQADLLLEMGVTNMRFGLVSHSATDSLNTPGQFIIVRRGNQNVLVSMDTEQNLLHYPVDITADNRFHLNTNDPGWGEVTSKNFERLDEMVSFIEEKLKMELVA